MITAFIIIYGAFCFFTTGLGFILGTQEVPEKIAVELWEKPWLLNSPIKIFMFFIFHGLFWIAYLNYFSVQLDKWWTNNTKAKTFEDKWKAWWTKKLF